MKLWKRLVVAVLAAGLASILAAVGKAVVVHDATKTYRVGWPAEALARVRAEEIADAKYDGIAFAKVLVPLTIVAVWWRSKRHDVP
jgi:hypothetical protein